MASVPSARLGHVMDRLRLPLTVVVLLALLFIFLPFRPIQSEKAVLDSLSGDMTRLQTQLNGFLSRLHQDASERGRRFARDGECELRSTDEVFVQTSRGKLARYCGEASYWRFHDGQAGTWIIHEHRGGLYFLLRLGEDSAYSRYLWPVNEPRDALFSFSIPRLSVHLALLDSPQSAPMQVQSDKRNLTAECPVQIGRLQTLLVKLSLNRGQIGGGSKRELNKWLLWSLLALVLFVFLLRWKTGARADFTWRGLLEEWTLLFVLAGLLSACFPIGAGSDWLDGGRRINLLFLLAALSGLIRSALFVRRTGRWRAGGWSIPACLLFLLALRGFRSLVARLAFPSDRFSFEPAFLVMLICGAAVLCIPLMLIHFDRLLEKIRYRIAVLFVLTVFSLFFLRIQAASLWPLVTLILALNLIVAQKSRWLLLNIPLIVVLLHAVILGEGEREKKAYIEDNLSAIFLNQGNYAKSIAREMVHEINSSIPDLRILFYPDENQVNLDMLWEQSLAAKENIPSGIFVCDDGGQVIKHVAHLIPYLDMALPDGSLFPFWAISQTGTSLYGRPTSVAYAAIRVYDGGRLLGTIYIQVLNISSLLHRDTSSRHIFALNPRISGHDIGFFRIDDRGRLAENPFQVSLPDEALAAVSQPQWLNLNTENGRIACYRFPYGDGESIYLFFARPSFVTVSAEWIKILLVLGLFSLLLFGLSPLFRLVIRYYRTFSFKVLLFLVLLTLGSALLLALSAYNFYHSAGIRNQERFWYEQGRVAQNMTINFLESSGGIDTESLILLGQLLNGELSVYQDGQMLDASNYRRIVAGEIPILMNSRINRRLFSGAEGVVLDRERPDPRVYFRVNDLVYMLELGGGWSLRQFERDRYSDFLINILFLIMLIGGWVVIFVRNHIVSPITVLNTAMAEVEKGNLVRLAQTPRESELQQLFNGFNAMVSGVREQQRSVSDLARMKTLVKMGRRVAHEVKNPLTPIKLSAEQIQRAMLDRQPGYQELIGRALQFIIEETEHLKRVSYGFLDLSKMDTLERQDFDIIELIDQELFAFRQLAPQVRFVLDSPSARLTVSLDRLKIKQVLKNLIQNAVDAIADKPGEIRVGTDKTGEKGELLRFWVADDGPGMSPEMQAQLFQENFSLKDSGFGIGLFIVKQVVELHGGRTRVDSAPGCGTTVWIELPLS